MFHKCIIISCSKLNIQILTNSREFVYWTWMAHKQKTHQYRNLSFKSNNWWNIPLYDYSFITLCHFYDIQFSILKKALLSVQLILITKRASVPYFFFQNQVIDCSVYPFLFIWQCIFIFALKDWYVLIM